MTEPRLRPLTPEDAEAGVAVIGAGIAQLYRAAGEEPPELPAERRAGHVRRLARFPGTDPGGSWAAEADGDLVGVGVAIRRGPLWGLALLFVDPEHQSAGLGRRLLEATRATAEGAAVEVIMASPDPRAIRRYASLGLGLHPAVEAAGTPDRRGLPGDLPVRVGASADLDVVEAVDRELRGVGRTEDVRFVVEELGGQLLVADRASGRGFALLHAGGVVCLGASDEATARSLLQAALAEVGDAEVQLHGLTATQGWAIDVALAARLRISPTGPMFARGWAQLPGPYLPSGVYF